MATYDAIVVGGGLAGSALADPTHTHCKPGFAPVAGTYIVTVGDTDNVELMAKELVDIADECN